MFVCQMDLKEGRKKERVEKKDGWTDWGGKWDVVSKDS